VPKQEKQARSDRLAIGKVISKLDAKHKEIKAPLKARVDLLDGERKRIKDHLLEVQGGIKSQIAEHEAKLKAHEDELQARIDGIRALAVFDSAINSILIESRLDKVRVAPVDDTFEHRISDAALAKMQTTESLEKLLADTIAHEKAAAEEARLKAEAAVEEQRLREEKIAREAEERAQAEANEKAEREAAAAIEAEKQAALKAEQLAREYAEQLEAAQKQAVIDAENAAKTATEKAEREALEAAERAEKEKAEAVAAAQTEASLKIELAKQKVFDEMERERQEREAREADAKHREGVEKGVIDALMNIECMESSIAADVLLDICEGKIPNVTINY
jgi:hypothetical protein